MQSLEHSPDFLFYICLVSPFYSNEHGNYSIHAEFEGSTQLALDDTKKLSKVSVWMECLGMKKILGQ